MATGCLGTSAAGFCLGNDVFSGNRLSCWELCRYRRQSLRWHCLVLAVSVATRCFGVLAAVSCLGGDVFGDSASLLVLVATSSAVASCFNANILTWRSCWQPVALVLRQQLLVPNTSAVASCLGNDVFGGDPFCLVGIWAGISAGLLLRQGHLFLAVSVLPCCLRASAIASCLGNDVFRGNSFVSLASGLLFAAASSVAKSVW